MLFENVCVLGSGLLGSSLLMAAKNRGLCRRAQVWSRSEATRAQARAQPWCDQVFDTPESAVQAADLVVLGAPVQVIPALLEKIAAHIKPSAIVTDVGSVKQDICAAGQRVLPKNFIGSHPMAGSEKTGIAAADQTLFEAQACFVVPLPESDPLAVEKLTAFWSALGTRVTQTDAQTHDRIVARVSHLPHALAAALCVTLSQDHPEWKNFSGNGLKDATRIAASDPELWKQIFSQNRAALLQALDQHIETINTLRQALDQADEKTIKALLTRAQTYRQNWPIE